MSRPGDSFQNRPAPKFKNEKREEETENGHFLLGQLLAQTPKKC
jgi:hypothetical protein